MAVITGAVVAAGGGVGVGASLGGASTTQVVDTAAGKSIRAKKADGKKAARKGDADEAWRRMGMRTLTKAVKQDLKCVANSFVQVREFLAGTGNITPLASTLLGLADISFTGHHYQSRRDGKTTIIAETEPATGQVSDEVLDAVADVAVLLPRP